MVCWRAVENVHPLTFSIFWSKISCGSSCRGSCQFIILGRRLSLTFFRGAKEFVYFHEAINDQITSSCQFYEELNWSVFY